jgi:hypothetical protein
MIKIIKENDLNIPVDTILHFQSFISGNNGDHWQSIGYYIYKDSEGILKILREQILYPSHKDIYINGILLDNLKMAFKGEEYWKVFIDPVDAQYHKLEIIDGKYFSANCLTPYKDVVNDFTNLFHPKGQRRFKTKEEARIFINSICKNIKI